jgi:hypothetical protein
MSGSEILVNSNNRILISLKIFLFQTDCCLTQLLKFILYYYWPIFILSCFFHFAFPSLQRICNRHWKNMPIIFAMSSAQLFSCNNWEPLRADYYEILYWGISLKFVNTFQFCYNWTTITDNTWHYMVAVALLVEALCYKPEGHGFDSQWGHWFFQVT